MTQNRFNPTVIIAKLDWFYDHGKPDKARKRLLEPWPGMDDDMTCFYQHLIAAGSVQSEQPLLLKSCSFNDDGMTYEFPDWMIAAATDLVARYGEMEGRLRWQKANSVFVQLITAPDGLRRLEQACSGAAQKMTLH
jgi:hypothetical protein